MEVWWDINELKNIDNVQIVFYIWLKLETKASKVSSATNTWLWDYNTSQHLFLVTNQHHLLEIYNCYDILQLKHNNISLKLKKIDGIYTLWHLHSIKMSIKSNTEWYVPYYGKKSINTMKHAHRHQIRQRTTYTPWMSYIRKITNEELHLQFQV